MTAGDTYMGSPKAHLKQGSNATVYKDPDEQCLV